MSHFAGSQIAAQLPIVGSFPSLGCALPTVACSYSLFTLHKRMLAQITGSSGYHVKLAKWIIVHISRNIFRVVWINLVLTLNT